MGKHNEVEVTSKRMHTDPVGTFAHDDEEKNKEEEEEHEPCRTPTRQSIRTRSGTASPLRTDATLVANRTIQEFVSAGADDLIRRTPAKLSNVIKSLLPILVMILQMVENSIPYIQLGLEKGYALWTELAPYHPEDALPMLLGLVLCFFGGSYLTLIAAVEAFRITGYKRFKRASLSLLKEAQKAYRTAEKDEEYCEMYRNREITSTEFLARTLSIIAVAVDPDKATDALSALWAGFIAVIATLKVHFAQAVTLGASIGDTLEKHTGPIVREQIQALLPTEHHRWAPSLSSYLFRFIGVTMAWMLHRIITAFHSAMRGGQLFASNVALLLHRRGGTVQLSENTIQYLALATAALGYLWQLSHGFSIPFPLNVVLLPVTMVEYAVTWCVHII